MGSTVSSWIVETKAVEGNQHNIVFRPLSRRVRRIAHSDDWRRILRETSIRKKNTVRQNSEHQATSSNNKKIPHPHSAYSALSSISNICRDNGLSSMQSIFATEARARSIVDVRQGSVVTT